MPYLPAEDFVCWVVRWPESVSLTKQQAPGFDSADRKHQHSLYKVHTAESCIPVACTKYIQPKGFSLLSFSPKDTEDQNNNLQSRILP